MHFLMPNVFPLANDFDLNDPDQEAKIKELHNKLKEYMLRRLKTEVIQSLPTKTERILRVELSSMQAQLYKNILTRVSHPSYPRGHRRLRFLNRTTKRSAKAAPRTSPCSTLRWSARKPQTIHIFSTVSSRYQ